MLTFTLGNSFKVYYLLVAKLTVRLIHLSLTDPKKVLLFVARSHVLNRNYGFMVFRSCLRYLHQFSFAVDNLAAPESLLPFGCCDLNILLRVSIWLVVSHDIGDFLLGLAFTLKFFPHFQIQVLLLQVILQPFF